MQSTSLPVNLQRFIDAQQDTYISALEEIKEGRKRTHWMWYIFPQIDGLGSSEISRYYAIHHLNEAAAYLAHPLLGSRLKEVTAALLQLPTNNAHNIFGSPDDLKLYSSMTLFALLPGTDPVFKQVLDKFFNGTYDPKTIQLTEAQE